MFSKTDAKNAFICVTSLYLGAVMCDSVWILQPWYQINGVSTTRRTHYPVWRHWRPGPEKHDRHCRLHEEGRISDHRQTHTFLMAHVTRPLQHVMLDWLTAGVYISSCDVHPVVSMDTFWEVTTFIFKHFSSPRQPACVCRLLLIFGRIHQQWNRTGW